MFSMMVCAFFGVAIPVIGTKFSLILLSGFIGCTALFISSEVILLALLVLALCVVGPLNYFGIVNLHWIPYIVGLLLYLKLILERFGRAEANEQIRSNALSSLQWAILTFFAILAMSTAFSPPGAHLLLLSSRNYFFMWSVFLLLARGKVKPDFFRNACTLMLWIALLQFPFAVYQNIFIAKNRTDNASWDAVVGTFPGLKDWGGDSGGMAIFLLSAFAIALCLWHRKVVPGLLVALFAATTIGTILAAEVKIVYVLIPIIFVAIYRTALFRNALLTLTGVVFITILFATISLTYDAETKVSTQGPKESISEKIYEIFKYSTTTDAYLGHGAIGRSTALAIWWMGNDFSDPKMYIGHGIASSAISQRPGEKGGAIGERYFPLEIDVSTAAVLLWETGIFGFLAFCSILIVAGIEARHLSYERSLPPTSAAILDASPAILAMYLITLFYHKNAIGSSESGQFLLLLFLGHIAYWSRRLRAP